MQTLRELIDIAAARAPKATFLIAPETGERLSYGELADSCRAFAGWLVGMGLQSGDRVAVYLGNGLNTARILLGLYYGGFVAVPINLLARDTQLAYVLGHCDARLLLTDREQRETVEPHAPLTMPVATIDIDARVALPRGAAPTTPPAPQDIALQMYTSGTTGQPKGVLLTHANLLAGARFVAAAHALAPADRAAAMLPLYHINAQVVTLLGPLVSGSSLVLPHRFSASGFWPLVAKYGCTWLNLVPTLIAYLLTAPPDTARRPSGVRFCRSASAPLASEQQRAFEARFGIGVIESMGLTETSAPCFCNPLAPGERRSGSPGRPFGVEARIADPASNEVLADGVVGEIHVRGPNVMAGYYKDPEATAAAFSVDGWLRTGDLGWRDATGFYYITGRLKELIIKGGENIAPREIDEVLLRHPAVLEAAAVGVPDPFYGQEILAGVVLKSGASIGEEELLAHCRSGVGPFKTPKAIRFLEALPKGPSGKVQRTRLLDVEG